MDEVETELNGTVTELFDKENGIIRGEDDNNYVFSKMDFVNNFDIDLEEQVIFKPKVYLLEKTPVYKAILIEKK